MLASTPPTFEAASSALLVPFDAHPLRAPRIAWLNRRYFLAQGHDMHSPEVVARIERECIANYAVSTLSGVGDPTAPPVRMGADRYGGSDGTAYGGSGRCGVRNGHIAKGIGPTPLVTQGAPWSYSHGQLFLHDAIREAIAAELCGAELPGGAVPTVAIIDTGHFLAEYPGGPDRPCAVAVRPCFFRASHLERSIFFGTAGFAGSDQFLDAKRVQDLNRYVRGHKIAEFNSGFDTVHYLNSAARQIAAIRAHRLWNGRPATGNLTIAGQYFDFGAFRALPNWEKGDDLHGQIFGNDSEDIAKAQDSLDHYQGKYCGNKPNRIQQQQTLHEVLADIDKEFSALCVRSCGAAKRDGQIELGVAFLEYFRRAQRSRYAIDCSTKPWEKVEWLPNSMVAHLSGKPVTAAARPLVMLLSKVLIDRSNNPLRDRHRLLRMARWLHPRASQYYGISRDRAIEAVRRASEPSATFAGVIDRHIRREIATARRVWNRLADDVVIMGVAVKPDFDAIFVYRVDSDRFDTIYEAVPTVHGASIRGEWIDAATIKQCREREEEPRPATILISEDRLVSAGHKWRCQIPIQPDHQFPDAVALITTYRGSVPWRI